MSQKNKMYTGPMFLLRCDFLLLWMFFQSTIAIMAIALFSIYFGLIMNRELRSIGVNFMEDNRNTVLYRISDYWCKDCEDRYERTVREFLFGGLAIFVSSALILTIALYVRYERKRKTD